MFILKYQDTVIEPIHSVPLHANSLSSLDKLGPVPHLFHSNIISLYQNDIFGIFRASTWYRLPKRDTLPQVLH